MHFDQRLLAVAGRDADEWREGSCACGLFLKEALGKRVTRTLVMRTGTPASSHADFGSNPTGVRSQAFGMGSPADAVEAIRVQVDSTSSTIAMRSAASSS
jgi:hypothetical protein